MRRLAGLVVVLALLAGAAPWAAAADGVCEPQLRRALPLPGVSDGVVAVELLAAAVRQVEPALRPWRNPGAPIPAGERGAEAARFVASVGLLPDGWSLETHDLDAWQAMHARFAGWYRATPATVQGGNREGMLSDMVATLGAVSGALRPLVVFATGQGDEVTFFAVMWNWTPQPRLLLFEPAPGLRLGEGRGDERAEPVLAAMSGCALRFERFAYAPEDLAIGLFGQQGESIFRVVASDPPEAGLPAVFEAERLMDVFRFDDPALAGVRVLSGGVEGPSIGAGTVLRLLAVVRTNINLDGIFFHTAFP
ncbi:MAG: hypothetical protein EA416_05165 [Trueperaceae bacterium]|nr:MAG: hypothetical protein EA416_05165 [Trueperaceae bacterium]